MLNVIAVLILMTSSSAHAESNIQGGKIVNKILRISSGNINSIQRDNCSNKGHAEDPVIGPIPDGMLTFIFDSEGNLSILLQNPAVAMVAKDVRYEVSQGNYLYLRKFNFDGTIDQEFLDAYAKARHLVSEAKPKAKGTYKAFSEGMTLKVLTSADDRTSVTSGSLESGIVTTVLDVRGIKSCTLVHSNSLNGILL